MKIIGLTGGIASGKSLVARVFKDLGAHVIDADRIVHDLLEPGQAAWQDVVDHFGKVILTHDKCIDRRRLGAIVFNDINERNWLNACLHPKVFDVYTGLVNQIRSRHPNAVIILDAALLIETGYYRKMDAVIVVYADIEQQYERLMDRDKFTREQAEIRISSQIPLHDKREQADYVIDNTGTREDTEKQARDVFNAIIRQGEPR